MNPAHCGDSCDGTGGKPCGQRDDCQCYRAAKGGNVCIEGSPACGGSGRRFCKKACYK